jgi:hypothetical protein
MIPPRKLKFEAKKKQNENMEFRTFLKCNADETELDQQFLRLHEELFADYDCNRCRNCCKMYHGSIPAKDVEQDALYLNMSKEEFLDKYLVREETKETYQTKHRPCDFLKENGMCKLGDCKPENCVKFPYTNQPERMQSLFSVLDVIEVCPVAYEIYERLKQEYGFKKDIWA